MPIRLPAHHCLSQLLGCLAILVLAACGDDGASPTGEPVAWIRGRVETAADAEPGVITVASWTRENEYLVRGTVDIEGNFAFPVPAGDYSLRLDMESVFLRCYLQDDGTITDRPARIRVAEGAELRLDAQLGSVLLTFDFPEGYDNGRIFVDARHETAVGIRPRYRWDRVDDRQTVRMAHLPPGNYTYTIDLGSRFPLIRLRRDAAVAERIECVIGVEARYDAVLPPQAFIEVVLSDPDERIGLYLESYPDGDHFDFVQVGAGSNLAPFFGDSVVVVATLGTARWLGPQGTSQEPTPLRLDPEQPLRIPVEFGRLEVEPLDSRVRLEIYELDGSNGSSVSLRANPLLWRDRFYVRVVPFRGQAELGVAHWAGGAVRMTDSEPIDVRSGTARFSWSPVAGGVLRGSFPTPQPPHDLRLAPNWPGGSGEVIDANVDASGLHFEITGAPVGEFHLVRVESEWGPFRYYPGVSTPDSAEVIAIAPGAVIENLDWIR